MTPTSGMREGEGWMLFITLYLLWHTFQALFVPAGEYGSRGLVWVEILLTLAMTIVLPVQLAKNSGKPTTGLSLVLAVLGPVAVVGGVLQLIARFTSNHGWWTGHFRAPVF
jgi:predicted phage tail protein